MKIWFELHFKNIPLNIYRPLDYLSCKLGPGIYDLCSKHVQQSTTTNNQYQGRPGRRRWAARHHCRSFSSPCPFPTPDAEWGSGGECLYRGGRSQGRGPAWYLWLQYLQMQNLNLTPPNYSRPGLYRLGNFSDRRIVHIAMWSDSISVRQS